MTDATIRIQAQHERSVYSAIESDFSSALNTSSRNTANGTSVPTTSTGTASTTATVTVTLANVGERVRVDDTAPAPLRLTLSARPTVRWDESTVDNEGLGRKSSKRCCIFHKQRDFGESSSDSSNDEESNASENEGDRIGNNSSIEKPKSKKPAGKKKVPDYQRFHA